MKLWRSDFVIGILLIRNRKSADNILDGIEVIYVVETDKVLVYGKLQIDFVSRVAYVDGREIVLTRMEFDVLYFLASNADIAFTKEQIYEAVSKDDYSGGAYIVRDVIYRLRTKLEITNIHTLHGYGYKFSTENGKDNSLS